MKSVIGNSPISRTSM